MIHGRIVARINGGGFLMTARASWCKIRYVETKPEAWALKVHRHTGQAPRIKTKVNPIQFTAFGTIVSKSTPIQICQLRRSGTQIGYRFPRQVIIEHFKRNVPF